VSTESGITTFVIYLQSLNILTGISATSFNVNNKVLSPIGSVILIGSSPAGVVRPLLKVISLI